MPPIPALNLATSAAAESPVAAGLVPEGFADALLAFLSPESLPALSADELALGKLRIPGMANPFDPAKPTDTRLRDEPESELDPLLAMAAFPVAVPIAPPAPAMPQGSDAAGISSALDALGAALPRAVTVTSVTVTPVTVTLGTDNREREWNFEALDAHLAAAQANAHAAPVQAAKAEAVPMQIDAPLGSSHFREQSADALRWMVRNGESRAEISLRPADLGPIQVELRMVADRVEVAFVAAHPDTRDALQDQLPQLRDMLAESGIQLGQASVHDQATSDTPFFAMAEGVSGATEAAEATTAALPRSYGGDRLVDTFA